MLKVRGIVNCFLLPLVFCLPAVGQASEPNGDTSVQKPPESIVRHHLCNKTVSWLNTRSKADAIECDRLAESLLALDQATPQSYFVAAQSAWWRGQREVAIARLNKVIEQQGDKVAPGLTLPVGVVGRLWIATMARYSGSLDLARTTYEKVLGLSATDPSVEHPGRKADVRVLCHLYLAEIEANHLGNREKAVSHLRAAEAVKVDPTAVDELRKVYENWARYEKIKATGDKRQANQQLDSAVLAMPYAMSLHFQLTGLTASPLADGCDRGARVDLIGQAIRKQVHESSVSTMDKMVARFLSGFYYELKEDLPEAAKRYLEVFEEDSFVSVSAGFRAAEALQARGKAREARRALERVSARYPQLESLADRLEEVEK